MSDTLLEVKNFRVVLEGSLVLPELSFTVELPVEKSAMQPQHMCFDMLVILFQALFKRTGIESLMQSI